MDLSVVLAEEGVLKGLLPATKFFDSEVKRLSSAQSLLARTSHMACLTASGQGSITYIVPRRELKVSAPVVISPQSVGVLKSFYMEW